MICKVCNTEKPETEFAIRARTPKLIYRTECKACVAAYNKAYREANKETISARVKVRYEKNRDQILAKEKQRYEKKKDQIKAKSLDYYYSNKDKIKERRREYSRERLKTDPVYKTTRNLRNRLWYALENKGWTKSSNFSKYIGLKDYNDLKTFIEATMTPEMSWDNYGTFWDIDHIVPLSSAKDEQQLYKLCSHKNLRAYPTLLNRTEKRDTFDFDKELSVEVIDYRVGQEYLIKTHYLKRKAPAEVTFGLFLSNRTLVGVCTFHTPFSPGLKKMICGPEFADQVIELNRLAVDDFLPTNTESWFVSRCLKSPELKKDIVVSFADPSYGHSGTIYKALNFIYTGLTEKRKEFSLGNNAHAASLGFRYSAEELKTMEGFHYKDRSQKHRFVYFRGNKTRQKELRKFFLLG